MSYVPYLDGALSLYDFLGDGVSPQWQMVALKTVSSCSTGKSFHLSSSISSVCPRGVFDVGEGREKKKEQECVCAYVSLSMCVCVCECAAMSVCEEGIV